MCALDVQMGLRPARDGAEDERVSGFKRVLYCWAWEGLIRAESCDGMDAVCESHVTFLISLPSSRHSAPMYTLVNQRPLHRGRLYPLPRHFRTTQRKSVACDIIGVVKQWKAI